MTTITERVAAGAAFLDETHPGWLNLIDLDRLSITSSCGCMLGQLHGSYTAGLLALGYPNDLAYDGDVALGFMWDSDQFRDGREEEAAALTAEWKRVITERRAAVTAEGPCDLCGDKRPPGLLKRVLIGGEWVWSCTDRPDDHDGPMPACTGPVPF